MTNDKTHPVRVLQLTDPHLMADPAGALLGVTTRDSLDAVIDKVLRTHGQPDLVLATGDITQDASEQAYRVFAERLKAFQCPSYWIAGNHDDSALLQQVAREHQAHQKHIVRDNWQILMLDSSVPGKVHGGLAREELAFLEQTLAANPGRSAIVSLHHHPVDIGCDWMSDIGLENRDDFWQVIERFPQVKVVLWGHVHQQLDTDRKGVALMATPSTCIQFERGSQSFSVEDQAPGYRWLTLYPDGRFETEVARAEDYIFDLESDSNGY